MEVSLAEQQELLVLINKAIVHFRELPQPFMTRGHIKTRMDSLDEYWQIFKTKHFELVKMAVAAGIKKEMYPYFKCEMFYLADDTYNTTKGIMVDELQKIDSPNTKTDWKELATCNEDTFTMIKNIGAKVKMLSDSLITKSYLRVKISTLDEYWQRFSNNHFEILKLATTQEKQDHTYFKQEIFIQCEEEYIMIKGNLVHMVEKLGDSLVKVKQEADNTCFKQTQTTDKSANFSDKNDKWNTFRDICGTVVQDTQTLENIQNIIEQAGHLLKYLKPTVKNEDETENYLRKTLKGSQFSRSEVDTLLDRLLNQRTIKKATSKYVKKLIDETQVVLLEDRLDISNWDTILIHILCNKLDEESFSKWMIEVEKLPVEELPMLQKFTDFLDAHYRSLNKDPCNYESGDSDGSPTSVTSFDTYRLDFVKVGNPVTTANNIRKPFCYECGKFGHQGHECQYHE